MLKQIFASLSGALLLAGSIAAVPAQSREMCTDLVVASSYANLRSGPGTSYKVVKTVNYGGALTLTGTQPRGQWNEVTASNGVKGWVHDNLVRCRSGVVSKMTCSQVRVSGPQGAYMKAQPYMSSRTFRTAPRGEVLNLESPGNPIEHNGWYLLRSGTNRKYWAHESVITCR